MKRFAIILATLLLTPSLSLAACSADGSTVVFVNGILNSRTEADKNRDSLKSKFEKTPGHLNNVTFLTGYNPTHLAGVGDVAQTVAQIFGSSVSGFDLSTILMQIQPEVTTRKLFLVGHSQGALYTNAMYAYLLSHGEPRESVGVYNVGTPASVTAGGGNYLNNQRDLLVGLLTDAAKKVHGPVPLAPNIDIPLSGSDARSTFPGHSFSDAYLAGAPERVIGDISSGLSKLSSVYSSDTGDCFTPPDPSVAYRVEQGVFAVADPTAMVVRGGVVLTYKGTVVVFNTAASLAQRGFATVQTALGSVATLFTPTPPPVPPRSPTDTVKDFKVVKSLYGSSLEGSDVRDLQNQNSTQGASVATAFTGTGNSSPTSVPTTAVGVGTTSRPHTGGTGDRGQPPDTPVVVVVGESTTTATSTATTTPEVVPETDFFTATTTPPTLSITECSYSLKTEFCLIPTDTVTLEWNAIPAAVRYGVVINGVETSLPAAGTTTRVSLPEASSTISVIAYDAASTTATSTGQSVFVLLHPLVINEVAWAGTDASSEDQWIELMSSTSRWLDFSHVALETVGDNAQRMPLAALNNFYTPAVQSNFPSSHTRAYAFARSVGTFKDVLVYRGFVTPVVPFDLLDASGEQLRLVWEVGSSTVTLDETPPVSACNGWCAGSAASTTRYRAKVAPQINKLSMERRDLSVPGGDSTNWVSNDGYYISSKYNTDRNGNPVLGTPFNDNSLQYPSAGFSCADHPEVVRPGDHVRSNFFDCTFYSGFVADKTYRWGQLYRGVEGSSTPIFGADNLSKYEWEEIFRQNTLAEPIPDETPMFLAIWESQDPTTFGPYLRDGLATGVAPPHSNYRVVPFIYGS